LERSFKCFADRSNSIELIYSQVRYVDPKGEEIAKVVQGRIATKCEWCPFRMQNRW
jgi:hypothetical protein